MVKQYSQTVLDYNYCPPMELREGNVFSHVWMSFYLPTRDILYLTQINVFSLKKENTSPIIITTRKRSFGAR